jgi:hypothetical protein
MQIEYSLAPSTNHVHTRRPKIIEMDGRPHAAKSQHRWHSLLYHNPKRLGYEAIEAFHSLVFSNSGVQPGAVGAPPR